MTATATRRSRRTEPSALPEQPADQIAQPEQIAPAAQPEQPAADKTETIAELSAALRDALNAGNVETARDALAKIDARSAKPAPAPKGRTAQTVKRLTAQAIVDALTASLDTITAGPDDEPFTDAEREQSLKTVATICSYLPSAKSLDWPQSFATRTVLSTEKPAATVTEPVTETPAA